MLSPFVAQFGRWIDRFQRIWTGSPGTVPEPFTGRSQASREIICDFSFREYAIRELDDIFGLFDCTMLAFLPWASVFTGSRGYPTYYYEVVFVDEDFAVFCECSLSNLLP